MCTFKNYLIAAFLIVLTSCSSKSKKEGKIVHYVTSPTDDGSSLPYLFSANDTLIMSWVQNEGDSLTKLKYTELLEEDWMQPKHIAEGSDWFVNWADFPAITTNNGHILSHVLKKSSQETFSYDIKLNVLPKGGSQWKNDLPLHSDSTKTEHGFVTALAYKNDSFFVTWLDGRNTGGGHDDGGHHGAMSIRAAEVSSTGIVSHEIMLDDKTCDCCQTTAAITDNGPVVIYRDRSEAEIRDLSIVRRVEGNWTAPVAVFKDNWKINGCPVNGPKAAALANNLAVAWFTAADGMPKVKMVFSDDGGKNFATPIRVDEANAMGRVDVLLIDGENAIVSWMESTENKAIIKAVKVHKSGEKSDYLVITELDSSRKTGFPQMELVGDKVYFAWTDIINGVSNIKTAYVLIDGFKVTIID